MRFSLLAPAAVTLAALMLASAQSNSSEPSVNLFVNDSFNGDAVYAASIVTACADQTVYALQCISGPASASPSTCGPSAPAVTLTEGPSTYAWSYSTHATEYGEDVTAAVTETCSLFGTTAADCHATLGGSAGGQSTTITASSMLTGSAYHRFQVGITGGADKTASATGACSTSGAIYRANARDVVAMAVMGALGLATVLAL